MFKREYIRHYTLCILVEGLAIFGIVWSVVQIYNP